jgi:hypothetical protein
MPCRPSAPSFFHRSAGKTLSRSIAAARGAISASRELLHGVAQHVDRLAEVEGEAGQVGHGRLLARYAKLNVAPDPARLAGAAARLERDDPASGA